MLFKCGCVGAVEHVVIAGAPVTGGRGAWEKVRTVASGRCINVYSRQDWVLGMLHRENILSSGAAGLLPVCEGPERAPLGAGVV